MGFIFMQYQYPMLNPGMYYPTTPSSLSREVNIVIYSILCGLWYALFGGLIYAMWEAFTNEYAVVYPILKLLVITFLLINHCKGVHNDADPIAYLMLIIDTLLTAICIFYAFDIHDKETLFWLGYKVLELVIFGICVLLGIKQERCNCCSDPENRYQYISPQNLSYMNVPELPNQPEIYCQEPTVPQSYSKQEQSNRFYYYIPMANQQKQDYRETDFISQYQFLSLIHI
eukprot:TRINITY_DN3257_c0_g1_i1.p1 TRINITY_DN3257_c0_g1~~TRINITY_DN3257_c0_g1_i1.p1  ORF type:complete len:263 (+),score=28.43 TRINITY_DN3257_c0_g1_i1:103-789(+)